MREILSDLVAEEQSLDQLLQKIAIRDWTRRTTARGWTIQDIVAFLASSEEFALSVIEDGEAPIRDSNEHESLDEYAATGIERGRAMRPQDVIEWWRGARAGVVDALSRMGPSDRLPWFGGPIAARTFATARLTETWAYGLDVQAIAGLEAEDTARIRHVARFGWQSLPHAFKKAGHTYVPIRLEVIGPGYAKWVHGPEDAEHRIKGAAGEWCRVVTRRIAAADTSLRAEGDIAKLALEIASTAV